MYDTPYNNYSMTTDLYVLRKDITKILPKETTPCWQSGAQTIFNFNAPLTQSIINISSLTTMTSNNFGFHTREIDNFSMNILCRAVMPLTITTKALMQQFENNYIYPNPAKETVTITYSNDIKNVEMYNLIGQKVYEQIVGESQITINVNNFAKGAYVVKIYTDWGVENKK